MLVSDSKPDAHHARFDLAVAHHLHGHAVGSGGDGGTRNRDAAAAAGVDRGMGKHSDPQRRVVVERKPHAAELAALIDLASHHPDLAIEFGSAFDRDARGRAGLELREMNARYFDLKIDLAVDHDPEQRLGLRRRDRSRPWWPAE